MLLSSLHLLTLLLAALSAGSASVEVSEQVRHYEVKGSTVAEIVANLRTNGPTDGAGRRFHALTSWEISWVHRQRGEGRQCRLTTVRTFLEVTTTLPKWSPAPSTPASLVSSWDRYMRALALHEEGHKQLGIQAAQEIQRRLARIPAAPNCAALNASMRSTGQAVIKEYENRSHRYDRRTKHGATQGAVFPSPAR